MKKLLALLSTVVLAGSLTACGSSLDGAAPRDEVLGKFVETSVKLSDGRTIDCLIWMEGGMSCDWESAR